MTDVLDPPPAHAAAGPTRAGAPVEAPAARDAHRGRLFRKYLLLILSLVSFALLVSSGTNLYFSYREIRAALGNLQHEKAIGAASRIEQYVRQTSQQLGYAALPQLDAGDVEARRIEFLKLLRQAPEVTDIAQLDASGREQIAVSRLGMDVAASMRDRSRDPAFVNARRGQPWYGPVYFRKETEPYMTVAVRAGGENGPVTVAEVNLKFIWDVVSRIKIGARGKAYVVDAAGFLVADPDIGLVLRKTSVAALPHVAAAAQIHRADEPAMLSKDLAGTSVLTSVAPIESLGWNVFVEQPIAEVYARLDAAILRTAALLLAGLVISALAASALARGMVRPIRTLDEGAQRIGAGELDQTIVVKTGDELEGLADQFNRMTARLRESYAGLEQKVQVRTAELSAALQRQTATAEILRVISESPSDVTPVFEAIVRAGVRMFDDAAVAVSQPEDDRVQLRAVAERDPQRSRLWHALFPSPVSRDYMHGAALLDGRPLDMADALDERLPYANGRRNFARSGYRAITVVPMMREGQAIGAISVMRIAPGPLSDKQIGTLQTFADQAVIAIENVRLFNETKEALEQQTATAEVLQVISSSVADTRPVFDAILASCERLFGGQHMGINLVGPDGLVHLAAHRGPTPDREAFERTFPVPLTRESGTGSAILDRRVMHYADIEADDVPPYVQRSSRAVLTRSVILAPLLWQGRGIGAIFVGRGTAGPFSDKDIALLKTFADQAVIAIQNARLFNETKDALEQQTATAEILKVIASSPSNVQPVFDAIVESAARLFGRRAGLRVVEDGALRRVARSDPAAGGFGGADVLPIDRDSLVGAAVLDGRSMQVVDIRAPQAPAYPRAHAHELDFRAIATAPLMREGRALGVISVSSPEPGLLAPKDMELLATFADQAVIAIQNARLFNETKDALEQQTATSEVLKTISRTTFDLQPVLATLIESASRLCRADKGFVYLREGDAYQMKVSYRVEPGSIDARPLAAEAGTLVGRTALTREIVHIEDALNDPRYTWKEAQGRLGYRTMLGVPMLREGEPIGVVAMWRDAVQPFSERDIRVVTTFADQAVIALENARLLSEIQAKSRELEAANRHKSEFLANMSHELRTPLNAIIGFSEVLTEQMFGDVNAKQMEYLHDIHSSGQHLLSLINDVLDLSKIEAGRMELDLSCFDLGLLLDNSLTLVRERAQRHGLEVALDVGDGLGEWVADARKVKQVVVNLLSNAVKFTPTGGRVGVRARRLDAGGGGAAAEISVADTGVGIAPEEQALVFEEFRQARGDYLRKTEGTGLGLSLARRFVELHGGSIRVDSRPGAGSTFTVTLPLQVLEAIS